jgi:hypothetical protein
MGTSSPPDPNIYGPTVAFVLDPNAILFGFAAAGQAQVNRVTWQGWDWGMDLPGTEVISIAGYPAGKAVGATTLNLVLFTGDENMGWLAAMPLS